MKLAVINGPNLNTLGRRQPQIYGSATLSDLERQLQTVAAELGCELLFKQSNSEAELLEFIQGCPASAVQGIVINAAAFTHTSVALLDALVASDLPYVEVHISNIYSREAFRHHSYLSAKARGVICGLGFFGYECAVRSLVRDGGSSASAH